MTGGQTGVDRGFLDGALEVSFTCGGWCPAGRQAEDGMIPLQYPVSELDTGGYADRTYCNVRDSDGTLILTDREPAAGTLLTLQIAVSMGKPCQTVRIEPTTVGFKEQVRQVADWITRNRIRILHCAGPRASEWSQGHAWAHQFAVLLISMIREHPPYSPDNSRQGSEN